MMKRKIWGTAGLLVLCLTMTGCGIVESPHNIVGRIDGYFRARAACCREAADSVSDREPYLPVSPSSVGRWAYGEELFRDRKRRAVPLAPLEEDRITAVRIRHSGRVGADSAVLAVVRTRNGWKYHVLYMRGRYNRLYLLGICHPDNGAETVFRAAVFNLPYCLLTKPVKADMILRR